MLLSTHTKMPRNVGPLQAAAVLYGDWGTSKAYVIGLAFALTGHASFWLIALVSILNIIVGACYIYICKYYPNGGGVYASVRHRSKVLALLGAFFLLADYMVTASLSALSAFYYFGLPSPVYWAILSIFFIGIINFFGPRYSTNLALFVSIPTFFVMLVLAAIVSPYLGTAISHLEYPKDGLEVNWVNFVSIIIAMSGIESIANITGIMKLNKNSTLQNPCVTETSTKAILWVTIEVVLLTSLFGLAVNAVPDLTMENGTINAPGDPDVRDYMLRYMGQYFTTGLFGLDWGLLVGYTISIVIGILLLSAVNSSLLALEALLFIIASDREIPAFFKKLNFFGVPHYALLTAVTIPMILLSLVGDIASLADLYAVGFVGAIATNLGATSLNRNLPLKKYERAFIFLTFLIMLAIEITLLVAKPHAANFAITILAIGLFLRGLVVESYEKTSLKKHQAIARQNLLEEGLIEEVNAGELVKGVRITGGQIIPTKQDIFDSDTSHLHKGTILCASTHVGKTLEFALEEAKNENQLIYVLFVREQRVITQSDREKEWWEDDEACKIVDFLVRLSLEMQIRFLYSVSDSAVDTVLDVAKNTKVSRLILGLSRKNRILQLLQGNFISNIGKNLSPNIDMVIIS